MSRTAGTGAAQADLYQLYAYAHRYRSPDNVLLYPAVPGATAKRYRLEGEEKETTIRIEFLNLNRDLLEEREAVKAELRAILKQMPLDGNA